MTVNVFNNVFIITERFIFLLFRHKEAAAILKSVMAVLRAKQKEVEAIEAQLAKMMDELKVILIIITTHVFIQIAILSI